MDSSNRDQAVIVALGELLWDVFPEGAKFGGAPGNFAHHVAELDGDAHMVSAVGDDDLGHRALQRLQQSSIDTENVHIDPEHPTGSVDVRVDSRGHASYEFHEDEAWDHLTWTDALGRLANRCDAVCFGTLGQRCQQSRDTIQRFVSAAEHAAWRVLDLNLRPPFYDDDLILQSIELANVLKINDDELRHLATMLGIDVTTDASQAEEIRRRCGLAIVAVTRGSRGALVLTAERTGQEPIEVRAQSTDVVDTVGAGDSFNAAVTIGLLRDLPIDRVIEAASRIAEFVCTQAGATPELPPHLKAKLTT